MLIVSNNSKSKKKHENSSICSLINLRTGEKGEIMVIRGGRMVKQRLYDLGLTRGTILTVKGEAPFGGPFQVMVRGSILAIGRGIAAKIVVQRQS